MSGTPDGFSNGHIIEIKTARRTLVPQLVRLRRAWLVFCEVFCRELGLYAIVEWLARRLK